MFKRLIVEMAGPICICHEMAVQLEIGLDEKQLPYLVTRCVKCDSAVRVPHEKLRYHLRFDKPYPADAVLALPDTTSKPKKGSKAEEEVEIETEPEVTFADVAGIDEAVDSVRQLVRFLKDPERYERLGAKMPRGYLFEGPPGTGKTLLARAVAGEAGVPFHSATGSQFVEKYVGTGASRVRALFKEARKDGPSIVFIDELESLGGKRSSGSGGAREYDHALNQLLTEMDGFGKEGVVVVIGATNRPELLDEALLRPGRFTRKVHVPLPDETGRKKIFEVHVRNKPLAQDVDLAVLAGESKGFSGAEIADVANEAAIRAAELGKDRVDASDFAAALEKVRAGGAIGKEKARRIGF